MSLQKPARYAKRRRNPPGTAPGTLTADPLAGTPRLHAFTYDATSLTESDTPKIARAASGQSLWLNVDGLGDTSLMKQLSQTFGLHPLAMEDVVNSHQRPKAEDYGEHLFVVLQMPTLADGVFKTEQVAFFLGTGFVLTIQEHPGDVFNPVRDRLRNPASTIRQRGSDYLCYALIDAVIDAYFPVLEALGDQLEVLEDKVVFDSDDVSMGDIHALKREFMRLRSVLWPLRDLVGSLLREEQGRFSDTTKIFLRDCQDHAVQLIEMLETYREITTGMVDILLSTQANRTNEVMRVLTLIATIFIPLTFVVGVYGMNFDVMPELHWAWGYPAVMGVMTTLAVALMVWFRKKGWLGRRR